MLAVASGASSFGEKVWKLVQSIGRIFLLNGKRNSGEYWEIHEIVPTVLFTLFQDVCSSFPELSFVYKSYICRNCFRQILKYYSFKTENNF